MAKRSLRRRIIEYCVVAAFLAATALIVFPVYAYSGPGPSARREHALSAAYSGTLEYLTTHQGRLPDDLAPTNPLIAAWGTEHPGRTKGLMPQDPVPLTLWNATLQGRNMVDIAEPSRTIIFFEGADSKKGTRMVKFVNGRTRSLPGNVVVQSVADNQGVVPLQYGSAKQQ